MSAVSYEKSVSEVRFLRSLYNGDVYNRHMSQRAFARAIAEHKMHEEPIGNPAANVLAENATKNLSFWGIYHIIRKADKLVKQQAVASEPVRQSRGC